MKLIQIFHNNRDVYFRFSGYQHFGILAYVLLLGSKCFFISGRKNC